MRTSAAPVPEADRLQCLDVLRGFAVLGILVMNIQLFAMPLAAYMNPTALGVPSPGDFAIWSVNHVFADQKFMTIFSLLFGAGIFLMTSRVAERGDRPARIHYRRMLWLLVFGLLHAYLLWSGDILVLYALCGMVVFPLRRLPPRTLLVLGLGVLAIGSLISVAAGLTMHLWPPGEARAMSEEFWRPPPERIAQEIAAFRGGWITQLPMRAAQAWSFHTDDILYWGIWRAGGLMLVGMALLKWRVLTGERTAAFYSKLVMLGFALGLPLTAWGLRHSIETGWTLRDAFFLGSQGNYWGSILVSLGWIGVIVRLWQSGAARGMVRRLAAVGRMAFTCYILETVICTTIFYGHGLGLFGRVDRLGQTSVVAAVWIVLLAIAPLWLERFRFGPLEWLWRMLTYGRAEPLTRRPGQKAAAAI
jgi:uncharacterized protein